MAKITQKNKRNLRKKNKTSIKRNKNKRNLNRTNKKSVRRMKGGSDWEFAVGDKRLDTFINGKSEETLPELIDYCNKKYIENKHKGPSSLRGEGKKIMGELDIIREGEVKKKKEVVLGELIKIIRTDRRL